MVGHAAEAGSQASRPTSIPAHGTPYGDRPLRAIGRARIADRRSSHRRCTSQLEHRTIFGYSLLSELTFRAGQTVEDLGSDYQRDIDLLLVDEYPDLNHADIRGSSPRWWVTRS